MVEILFNQILKIESDVVLGMDRAFLELLENVILSSCSVILYDILNINTNILNLGKPLNWQKVLISTIHLIETQVFINFSHTFLIGFIDSTV